MGVPGLWKILQSAHTARSLTEIAVVDGFERNTELRGYRIGIDTSIWLFHAESGKEGENPHLRTLFFRCCTLMHAPFLPVFVFDGEHRPEFKRGKKINRAKENALTPTVKNMIEAFGYEWRQAPGEAEAELAYLNSSNQIDGILSDDVDTFLFGAHTIIRNPSPNLPSNQAQPALNSIGKKDPNWARVFTFPNSSVPTLTRAGLILIALLSGGDYHTGLVGCGPKIAFGLAQTTLAQKLLDIVLLPSGISQPDLDAWRNDLRAELKTNASGLLPKKCPSLAKSVPDTFPPVNVLMAYVKPLTSESYSQVLGRPSPHTPFQWRRMDPDLQKIAALCEGRFEWGYKELLIKRFRTLLWPWFALRLIRRAVLDPETSLSGTFYPDKDGRLELSSQLGNVFLSATRSRRHASTNNLLEYRVSIDPQNFVALAESGLTGSRAAPEDAVQFSGGDKFMDVVMKQALGSVEEADESGDDDVEEKDDTSGAKKRSKRKPPPTPSDPLLMWIPAVMTEALQLPAVEVFKEKERGKMDKGKSKSKSKSKTQSTERGTSKPKRVAHNQQLHVVSDTEDISEAEVPPPAQVKLASIPTTTSGTVKGYYRTTKSSKATSHLQSDAKNMSVNVKGRDNAVSGLPSIPKLTKDSTRTRDDYAARPSSPSRVISNITKYFPRSPSKPKAGQPSEKPGTLRPFPMAAFDQHDSSSEAMSEDDDKAFPFLSEAGPSRPRSILLFQCEEETAEGWPMSQATAPPLSQLEPNVGLTQSSPLSKHRRASSAASDNSICNLSPPLPKKSPKKNRNHTSARQKNCTPTRPESPTPTTGISRSKYKLVDEIIDISSDSDLSSVYEEHPFFHPLDRTAPPVAVLEEDIIDLT